ncbi:MAG: LysR family transcriptional regulator [Sulfitobacter sp.]
MSTDLRHLRCFVAVAQELHFHRAAKRLGVAQPALSRTIRNLERELGVTLFHRSNRSVQITAAGQTLLDGSKGILNSVNKLVEETQRVHQGKIGSLRIGYTDNAINGRAPTLLKRFQDLQPDIDLQLKHTVTAYQLAGLEDGTFDFGFVTGAVNRPGFDHCEIQAERFVCVVYEAHPFAKRQSVQLEELAHEPLVHGAHKEWEHFFSYLIPLCRTAGFEPDVAQEGLATSDILRLVACGMGITILTESVHEMLGPGLVVIPIAGLKDRLHTVALWRTDTTNSVKEHFIRYLQAQIHATS